MSVFTSENPSVHGRPFSSTRRMLDIHALASQSGGQAKAQEATSVPDRISALYRRYYADSSNHPQTNANASIASSRQTSSTIIKILLSQLVDALIFTSAIAITAYNYWTGSLNSNKQAPLAPIAPTRKPELNIKQLRQTLAHRHEEMPILEHHYFEDAKRQRTQAWAESVAAEQLEQRHHKNVPYIYPESSAASSSSMATPPKRRPVSLPTPPRKSESNNAAQEKQDEMIARMEERLQSLIQEGQAALTRKAEFYDIDYDDMSMRKPFTVKAQRSV